MSSIPLLHLLDFTPVTEASVMEDVCITGITQDSRRVQTGNLFVAVSGLYVDGHRFIDEAIQRGAAAIVGTKAIDELPVPFMQVEDSRKALARLSAAFYDFPARKLTVIGVTGTDGKTTTCNMIYQILKAASINVGMISTVNAVIGDDTIDTGFHVTTPEAPEIQELLSNMVRAGLTHIVIEATSHGLSQQRVAECEFDIGVITNITHEHLDYHGTFEEYRAVKAQLFKYLTGPNKKQNYRYAILNRDDKSYEYLKEGISSPTRIITYGINNEASVMAKSLSQTQMGVGFNAVGPTFNTSIQTNLLGNYNISNALAAISTTVLGLNIDPDAAKDGVYALKGIPGRMERIDMGQDFIAFVDFAHTPNALRRTLQTTRQMTEGQVIVVFGSAGLRDRAKRRMMAEISAVYANKTILTAEDPRTESLDSILEDMAFGLRKQGGVEGENFWRISDRGEAIYFALNQANTGDIVLVCGKGHEQSMCFGETEYPWDDRTALRAALAEYLRVPGPQMPFLPPHGISV